MPRPVKYVEIGRVAYAINGPAKGKLLAIVEIIDYNRVLVDGPCTGVKRQEYRLTHLQLTQLKIDIQHSQCARLVREAWKKAEIGALWKKSQFAQNLLQAEKRKSTTDYDRFRIARLKQRRSKIVAETLKKMQKYANARVAARPAKALAAKIAVYESLKKKADKIAKRGGPEACAKIMKEKKEKRKAKLSALAKKKTAYNEKKKAAILAKKKPHESEKPPTSKKTRHTKKKLGKIFKTDGHGRFIKTYGGKLVKISMPPRKPKKDSKTPEATKETKTVEKPQRPVYKGRRVFKVRPVVKVQKRKTRGPITRALSEKIATRKAEGKKRAEAKAGKA